MENKASYFYVGLFVFGVIFAGLAFVSWMGSLSQKENFKYYEIYTQSSVSGLGEKSAVKLLGVDVGSIEKLNIDTKTGVGVVILIKVKENTPVTQNTYATFNMQGITGLKFIELNYDESHAPELKATSEGKLPRIPVRPTLLSNLDKQGDKIMKMLDFLDSKFQIYFTDENAANMATAIKNFAILSKDISDIFHDFGRASDRLAVMAENYSDLKGSLSSSLSLLERLLIELNEALSAVRNSPSDLLFKRGTNKLAPGE